MRWQRSWPKMRKIDGLHIKQAQLEMVLDILERFVPGVEVWAYGSRVNGDSFDSSDLDLVLRSPDLERIPVATLSRLAEAFSDSNLPILVDFRDWATLPTNFHRQIELNHIPIA